MDKFSLSFVTDVYNTVYLVFNCVTFGFILLLSRCIQVDEDALQEVGHVTCDVILCVMLPVMSHCLCHVTRDVRLCVM